MTIAVELLFVHPIKSMGVCRVERAAVGPRGFANDRRYMLVDDDGVFVTQRSSPTMATFFIQLDTSGFIVRHGDESLELPYSLDSSVRAPVRVWKDEVDAVVAPADYNDWFSTALGRSLRLVYMPDDAPRRTGFADAFPFLAVSIASIDLISKKSGQTMEPERFRANLVLSGLPPHGEDELEAFQIGSIRFRGTKRCGRCSVPNVDPTTGVRGQEPARTLATYRKFDQKVMFGMNLDHEGAGSITIGDEVRVL